MFLLICRYNRVSAFPGDDITLSSHLSPETSAVPMEVRWFRGTECIYLYKNGQASVGRGYEGRASLVTPELKRGNVSLVLKSIAPTDTGTYSCQVLTGHNKVEKSIHLYMSGMEPLSPVGSKFAGPALAEKDDVDMDESVLILELRKLLQQREKELEDATKRLETTSEMLRTKSDLLQYKDAELEGASRAEIRNEERLRDALRALETREKQVERLGRELEAKNAQVEELRGFLRDKERELEEEKRREKERPEEQVADVPKVVAEVSADAEGSVRMIEMKNLLQNMETALAEKSARSESAAGELREATERLRDRERDVAVLAKERDEYAKHMGGEMEMCLLELETLGQKLQEKNAQVEELRAVLRAKERGADKPEEKTWTRQEDLESWIRRRRERARLREEDEKAEALENEFREYVSAVQELMATKHETMRAWEKMASVLRDKLRVAETDETRAALGAQMEEALEMQRLSREQIEKLNQSVGEKRSAVEERHEREVEEIREKHAADETHILKTLLPDVQAYFQHALEDALRRYRSAAGDRPPGGANLEMIPENNEDADTDSGDEASDAVMNGENEAHDGTDV